MIQRRLAPEWSWLWREVRFFAPQQGIGLLCVLLASAAGLAVPLLMKWLIDGALPNRRWDWLLLIAALCFAAWFGRAILLGIGQLVSALAVQRMTFSIRARLVAHVQSLPAAFFREQPTGDLIQRLERDVTLVGETGSDLLPSTVRMGAEAAMMITVMLLIDWRVAVIVLPFMPLFALVRRHYRATLQQASEATRAAAGRQSSLLHELITGAIQIQLLGAEARVARRYRLLSIRTMRQFMLQRKQELRFTMISMGVMSLAMALIIGYGGVRVLLQGLTPGDLVAFYGYIGGIFAPLNTAMELYSRMNRVRASIRRLMDLERLDVPLADVPDAVPVSAAPRLLHGDNLSFAYASDRTTLHDIQFKVRAGERVAIVGESGCGKSSLLQLIPRLYDAREGALSIDAHDVRGLQLRSLRSAISFVPQEPVLFQGTLRENIRCACPSATAEELAHVAWIACFADVVARLPDGWDTPLGPAGAGLSGGERQRLAIARALLLDRPILVLDEATSALDAITERLLLSRLEPWCANRLVIVVSHRSSAAIWAHRVVVLSHGAVIAEGTHESLSRQSAYYRTLWQRRQASEASAASVRAAAADAG
jgi:ABC-type multidrug transport system fused ATPase/permease subunit